MKVSLSQIKAMTQGAAVVEEREDGIHFNRFTKEQTQLYKERLDEFYMKSFAATGIRLHFCTDSEILFLKAEMQKGSSRTYFCFEVFVNGERVDTLDNFSHLDLEKEYTKVKYELGEFSKEFSLGKGEKEVLVIFPWSASVTLKELSLSDGAHLRAMPKPEKKILCFGDSITQGYDSLYPSSKYISNVCKLLGGEEFNKAIGGEVFFPGLSATKEDFTPDYITVAYGTNDWFKSSKEDFCENCKKFFENLTANYSGIPVFVITPIWRKDLTTEENAFGPFEEVEEVIKQTTALYENITVFTGFDFVPHDESFYGDLRLHPNDKGFAKYFESLSAEMKKHLN